MPPIDILAQHLQKAIQLSSDGGEQITYDELQGAFEQVVVPGQHAGDADQIGRASLAKIGALPEAVLQPGMWIFRKSARQLRDDIVRKHGGVVTKGSSAPAVSAGLPKMVAKIVTTSVPEAMWDARTASLVRDMTKIILSQATPPWVVTNAPGSKAIILPVVYEEEQRAGKVRQKTLFPLTSDKVAKLRLFLPISGHTMDENSNGIPDAIDWAKVDRAMVWVRYVDAVDALGNALKPGADIPYYSNSKPRNDSRGPDSDAFVIARDIGALPRKNKLGDRRIRDEATHHLVRVVDVPLQLRPGKIAILMFDGNSEGPAAAPSGYAEGRTFEIFTE